MAPITGHSQQDSKIDFGNIWDLTEEQFEKVQLGVVVAWSDGMFGSFYIPYH